MPEAINVNFSRFLKLQVHDQKPNAYTMQPNVMKKSWTTSNIASAVEHDDNDRYIEEAQQFKSRDLIREYLLKTRVPEILKPWHSRASSPFSPSATPSDMNFAYKHPLVVAEELKNGSGEAMAIDLRSSLANIADNSSVIVPHPIKRQRPVDSSSRPHLIGKVTPTIARAWEQLSQAMDSSMESHAVEDDKQSYVLFVRKPLNFHESDNENFSVNKIQHSEDSEKFFDSIDEDAQYAEDYEEELSEAEGGEMMAEELDSLDLRCDDIILWSIES